MADNNNSDIKEKPFERIHVTVKQKIMLHLMHFTNIPNNSFNVVYDITQDGISNSVGVTRAHVSVELKKLRECGAVVTWKAHILGSSTKRLAYILTPSGIEDAKCLD